ncbi:probable protein phosphatase 2C 14 [Syzygium oleosum]|uniref:probable protein phosphatase 2C 14 n=1 Tax=Syzygium oleosum TaxID=219896 RepID=UPI0011D18D23|nr:probable protein phosphatase 2C 14 [Syzygium oleosum]
MSSDPSSSSPSTSALAVSASSAAKRKRPSKLEIPNVLRELQPSELRSRDLARRDGDAAACFGGPGVAVASFKGKKKLMEDAYKIASSLDGNPCKGFFGVYDGHGGRKAAEYVAEHLHENILEMMVNAETNSDKTAAIKAGYLKTDQEFMTQGLSSGACCVTALVQGQDIAISNLGDCRAVLCRGGKAETLTKDHRADKEEEKQRIEDMGGFVEMHRGSWRVHGILSVSRSIGDAHLKQWVMAEPDTRILHLTVDMEFLVLASDGLWEEVGNQEAVNIVRRSCIAEKGTLPSTDLDKDENDEYRCVTFPSTDLYKDVYDECGCVNVSPSSKLRRILLLKQQKRIKQSPSHRRPLESLKDGENEFLGEINSPPLKSRRISLFERINTKTECLCSQENNGDCNNGFSSAGLVAACTELANLAISRGSLDDITVMVIDLTQFRRDKDWSL